MIKHSIIYEDLTGGLNNVDSINRINSSTRRTETPDIKNVEYFELGGIKSMDGNTQIGDIQSSAVIGGWEYKKDNNRYLIIATKEGYVKIYNEVTNKFDTIYKFSHQSQRVSFTNMNNGVVASNGVDDLIFYEKGRHKILSGTVSTTIDNVNVVGMSTKFKTELRQGDSIEISGNVYFVDEIVDDTNLKLRTVAKATGSDLNLYLSEVSECNATLVNEDDSNVSTPIRGLAIQYYKGRLWVGGDNGVFYSQVGMYNGWDIKYDAGVIYSIFNDSSEVTALGLYSEYLMIHKKFSSYILTITSTGETISISPYSNISCDSQQSWIQTNLKYYVYSKEHKGIYPLGNRTVYSDKYIGDEITTKVHNLFDRIRINETNKIFVVNLTRKRWLLFYLPLIDNAGSGNVLIFDFQTKSWLFRKLPQEVSIAFNYDTEVYVGTEDGKVLKEFAGKSFDGKPIESYYRSPWFDWAGGYSQSFSEFSIELADDYTNKFYLRSYKNGVTKYEDRIIDSENLLGYGLVWEGDEDLPNNETLWDEEDWVSSEIKGLRMVLPNNVFDKFQIEIGTNELNQGFAIYGYAFRRVDFEEVPW